jgi:hypothetical protein
LGQLPLKGFKESLVAQVLVPMLRKLLVLVVKADVVIKEAAFDPAAPLRDAEVIVAVVECVEGLLVDLEAHLRVSHEVTVLFAIVATEIDGNPVGPDSSVASITSAM